MEILSTLAPYLSAIVTAIVGWIVGKKKSAADLESIKADNADKLLKINEQYIVEPLTKKINELNRIVKKLEKAVSRAADCTFSNNCPVRVELQKHETDNCNREKQ
jgi:hypothetical protein